MKSINEFKDDYFFLSNFYPAPVTFKGITYYNSEAAFQAQKCPERAKEFIRLFPSNAKALGRKVSLRSDWEEVKDSIMYHIVFAKFNSNEELRQKLIETGDTPLIEGNTWHDTYWGVCDGVGKNKLGKILMEVRRILK